MATYHESVADTLQATDTVANNLALGASDSLHISPALSSRVTLRPVLSDSFLAQGTLTAVLRLFLSESLTADDPLSVLRFKVEVLAETLGLSESADSLVEFLFQLQDAIDASDTVSMDIVLALGESILFSEGSVTAHTELLLELAEQLSITESLAITQRALLWASVSMALSARLSPVLSESLAEAMQLDATLLEEVLAVLQAAEAMQFSETLAITQRIYISLDDTAEWGESASTAGVLMEQLRSGMSFTWRTGLFTGAQAGAAYEVWAVNTETGAPSRYTNFGFRDFARIGKHYVAVGPDGLYALRGGTDAGSAIAARIRTGLMDFDVPELKRLSSVYLGYVADDKLVLKVTTTRLGQPETRWYRLTPRATSEVRGGRVQTAKGVAGQYWEFEIESAGGADFSVDALELQPLVLRRKV